MTVIVTQSLFSSASVLASNNVAFRDFVSTWTNVFSASGWINNNASGSINPSTVNAVSNNTIAGYQVWGFNDTLHNNGYPVYVKVEYGCGADQQSRNTNCGLWLQAGFMHNGSGSINPTGVNGVGSTPRGSGFFARGANNATVRRSIRFCCISGSDAVGLMGDDSANDPGGGTVMGAFSVERTKDANGNSTNEGIVVSYMQGPTYNPSSDAGGRFASSHIFYKYNTASYVPVEESIPNYILSNGHGAYANNVTLGMFIPILSSSFGYPSRMLGIVNGSSLTQNATHTMTLFGTSSTYFISNNTAPNDINTSQRGAGRADTTGNFRFIMRYE